MKIRTGFVSNSSSSSFCIYGFCIEPEKLIKALIKKGYVIKEFAEKYEGEEGELVDEMCSGQYYEDGKFVKIEGPNFFKDNEFTYHWDLYDSGELYIGRDMADIIKSPDKSVKQWMAEVQDPISELLDKKAKCSVHEQSCNG